MTTNVDFFFFFFNDTATTEIYTLSLHDALPICAAADLDHQLAGDPDLGALIGPGEPAGEAVEPDGPVEGPGGDLDRKSTRLNSSHGYISDGVFCFKKKKKHDIFINLHQLASAHV